MIVVLNVLGVIFILLGFSSGIIFIALSVILNNQQNMIQMLMDDSSQEKSILWRQGILA